MSIVKKNQSAIQYLGNLVSVVYKHSATILIIGLVVLLFWAWTSQAYPGTFIEVALKTLGQTIFVSGLVAVFVEQGLRQKMLNDFSETTEKLLNTFATKIVKGCGDTGLCGVHPSFDVKNVISQLEHGDELLWLDTYAPTHIRWLDLVKAKAVSSGVRFRFLVLDHTSASATQRSIELGGRFLHAFTPELKTFEKDLQSLSAQVDKTNKGAIQVKKYSDLLAVPMYIIKKSQPSNSVAYTSFYLKQPTGVDFPHVEWESVTNGFINYLIEYFEWKWQSTKP